MTRIFDCVLDAEISSETLLNISLYIQNATESALCSTIVPKAKTGLELPLPTVTFSSRHSLRRPEIAHPQGRQWPDATDTDLTPSNPGCSPRRCRLGGRWCWLQGSCW